MILFDPGSCATFPPFCSDCLTESMKSALSCPVCKVPFRRREIRPAPHMDNLVSIFKTMEAATGTNVVSTQVTPAVKVADGSNCVNSGKISKRSQKPLARKKKVSSKKEKNTAKDARASTSCPTTKPSFRTNKRIHVTPFPESETPIRADKIMKHEEPKNNLNGDVGEDSDHETPLNITPNSKDAAIELLDSEMFEWTQRPCSPELCSSPLKKQSISKNNLDQIKEKGDEEDIHIDSSFDKLGHASNESQLVNTKETKQNNKKASARNRKNAKLLNRARPCIKRSDDNQQSTDSPKSVAANSCQKNSSSIKRNTSGRRNKAASNINQVYCSNDNSLKSYLPKEDGPNVESHDNHLSERTQNMEKNIDRKQSARNLAMAQKTMVNATESNSEPRSKRSRRMSDHDITETVGVLSGSRNEAEYHSFIPLQKAASSTSSQILEVNRTHIVETEKSVKILVLRCPVVSANLMSSQRSLERWFTIKRGKQVPAEFNGGANIVHCHKNCLEWAPDVYFEDESVFNLTTELARSRRIKCACCGIKGAALGCFDMSCRRSFHFTCAKLIPECRWDNENFVMLCPLHQSSKLPNENSERQKQSKRKTTLNGTSQVRSSQNCGNNWKWPSGSPHKWVLCCSSLSAADKEIVSEFAKLAGVPISTSWSPNVTHVIASTDPSGACKRTLKFLMAILNGRWIISIDFSADVHGIIDGPRLGRCRVMDKQPKLFHGMRFYLHGDYNKSYSGYVQELVVAAGGTVLQRKPVSRDQQRLLDDSSSVVLIVYSVENQDTAKSKGDIKSADRRQAAAQILACASGGKAVSSAWVIDSIAASKLQPL
ncbi:hypothetical protein GUJ93_ZPchr0010g9177 [Zizania palustris]|uniref:Uncharacterized protein n=1 Tax=Zizania palustris TaxID=103762 RepID=A0A8J6BDG1_ZIZPA|nr:hypothetical protein GUJ93_ZPchr0010g9177 [Zizania palustris]